MAYPLVPLSPTETSRMFVRGAPPATTTWVGAGLLAVVPLPSWPSELGCVHVEPASPHATDEGSFQHQTVSSAFTAHERYPYELEKRVATKDDESAERTSVGVLPITRYCHSVPSV